MAPLPPFGYTPLSGTNTCLKTDDLKGPRGIREIRCHTSPTPTNRSEASMHKGHNVADYNLTPDPHSNAAQRTSAVHAVTLPVSNENIYLSARLSG